MGPPSPDPVFGADQLCEARGEVSLAGESSLAAIPDARGVVVLEDTSGGTILVAGGARMRRLVEKRLGEGHRDSLAGAAARAVWRRTGSTFAADLVFLEEARRRAPTVHEAVTDRWQGWFVGIDPIAAFPVWEKLATRRLAAVGADPALTLGPFADKHAAGRAMRTLDSLYELCRYPDELRRAPDGRACAYKEMGRCPAACDGSEPLDAYRSRVGEAVRLVRLGVEGGVGEAESSMREAAERLDFELAERLKRWLDEAKELLGRPMRWARSLAEFRFLAVARSHRAGWAQVARIDGGRLRVLGAVGADAGIGDVRFAAGEARGASGAPLELDDRTCATIGLVSNWLYNPSPERRGQVAFVRLDRGPDLADQVLRAVRSVLRVEPDDEAATDRAMELA